MFKHPWLLKNYHPSEKEKIERKADKFYWICIIVSGVSFGVYGFWVNYFELMIKAIRALSIPAGIMAWTFTMLLGAWINSTLPTKGKYIGGSTFLVMTIVFISTSILMIYN